MYRNVVENFVPTSSLITETEWSVYSDLAVVTGWTHPRAVNKQFRDKAIVPAVIGSLYSDLGINYLFYNLLANPQIVRICLIDTHTDKPFMELPLQHLKEIFEMFTKPQVTWENKYNIDSRVYDILCSRAAIFQYEVMYFTSIESAVQFYTFNPATELTPVFASVVVPPPKISLPETLPSDLHGHVVRGTLVHCYEQLLDRIMRFGRLAGLGDEDNHVKELLNFKAVIKPYHNVANSAEYFDMDQAEHLLRFTKGRFYDYFHQINTANEFPGVKYTYGQRIKAWFQVDQIEIIREKLLREKESSSAVINLWDVHDNIAGGSPCLNHLWFKKVGHTLTLTTTYRSHDMFEGWPLNCAAFSTLLVDMAVSLNLQPGYLVVNSLSAHIYRRSWEAAENHVKFLRSGESGLSNLKERMNLDPIGYFVFIFDKVGRSKVLIHHYHNDTLIHEYEMPPSSRGMGQFLEKVTATYPMIMPDHVAYLAKEFMRSIE